MVVYYAGQKRIKSDFLDVHGENAYQIGFFGFMRVYAGVLQGSA